MLTSDDLTTMLIEIVLDQPPSLRSPEADAQRERLREQIAAIKAEGLSVHIPGEIAVPTRFRE